MASQRWPELFPDPWAAKATSIRELEGSTAEQLDDFSAAVYGLRHKLTVIEIKRYLAQHPGAAVVNIGCGLDRLVHEISSPDSVVYNIDFPEVIEMRERWIEPHAREVNLPFSVTDHRWMDAVDASRGLIAVAAGVFYYLEVDEVKNLVRVMGERFPAARLCYDAESPFVTEMSERAIKKNGTPDAHMPFRVRNPLSIRQWSDTVENVRVCFDFTAYLADRSPLPWKIRRTFWGMKLIRGMYEVVVTFRAYGFRGLPPGQGPGRIRQEAVRERIRI